MTKKTVVSYISGTIHHMIFIHGTRVEKENISMFFLHFSKILFFGVSSEVKGQKLANLYLYISRTVDHIIKIFSTQV